MKMKYSASLLASTFLLAACSSSDTPLNPVVEDIPVSINFAAVVGNQAMSCTQSFAGVGNTGSTVSISEFMAYVSDVSLIKADGGLVPVALTPDNKWQIENIALLDFAAGGPGTNCANASPETNTSIIGTVPGGADYKGLRFTLGLPFSRNHGDATTAPSPLSASIMFWSWNSGYKAMRLDMKTTGLPNGWFLHVGSTGCTPTGSGSTVPTSCQHRNVKTFTFNSFDHRSQSIVADVKTLLASSNIDVNAGGPAGCMSGTSDGDCSSIFASIGLPFNGGAEPATQSLFRVANN